VGGDVQDRRSEERRERFLGRLLVGHRWRGEVPAELGRFGANAGERSERHCVSRRMWRRRAIVGIRHDHSRRLGCAVRGEPQEIAAGAQVADEVALELVVALGVDQRLERDEVELAVRGQDQVRDLGQLVAHRGDHEGVEVL